ncbi:MAG: hypothetical protein V1652_00080 [bacterium]
MYLFLIKYPATATAAQKANILPFRTIRPETVPILPPIMRLHPHTMPA